MIKGLKYTQKVLDSYLAYKRFFMRIPGMSVGVVYEGEMVYAKGFGEGDVDTCYRIASHSKMFTALAIMQLVEQGKVNLDDKAALYLPWLNAKDKYTIRELLSHTAGVNRDGDTNHWIDDNFPDIESIKKQAEKSFFNYEPNTKWKYSNLGMTLLGLVVEVVSGESYKEYVKKNILDKLDLRRTYPDWNSNISLSQGYGRDVPGQEREKFINCETKAMSAAAGFISNVPDLCKFLSFHMNGKSDLISVESKREMQRLQWVDENDNGRTGLGFETWKCNGARIFGHGGAFAGYRSKTGFDKDRPIGATVLTNTMNIAIRDIWDGVYTITRFFNENEPKGEDKYSKYEGVYTFRWGEVMIVAFGDKLLGYDPSASKPFDNYYELTSITENEFKITKGDDTDVVGEIVRFVMDDQDNVKGLYFGPNFMKTVVPTSYLN
jgi:D-alanyl-D-alanine carboxypeptidase